MALRLRVVSIHAQLLGEAGTRVFGVHGGSIGRASDNDWILPDPERYISGHHARIEYRNGQYWLTDTSSNGTYLNESTDPLPHADPHKLKDGDRVRMGDYDLVVSVDAANDFPPEKSAIVAYDGRGGSAAMQSTEQDLGEPLNLDALLSTESSGSQVQPVNAYGQALALPPKAEPQIPRLRTPVARSAVPAASNEQTPWNLSTRRKIDPYRTPKAAPNAAPTVPPSSPRSLLDPPTKEDPAAGLQALCRGAGIDLSVIPTSLQPQALQIAGQILREVVMGLMETLQARTELRNRFRISQETIQPAENNPFKFSAGVDEALRKLFEQQGNRYLGPVDSVRESLRDIRLHQQALQEAMHVAFKEFIHRLDPEELQERFDRGLKRGGLLGATNKMKYWELYGELYNSITQMPHDTLPHVFVEDFARAYEAKMMELSTRKPRAADSHDDEPQDATRVPVAKKR